MNPALPSMCSQTHPLASPSRGQATAETQGVGRHRGSYPTTLLHVCNTTAGKHCISPRGLYQRARGLYAKFSFHSINSHVKHIHFSPSGLLLLILRSDTSYSPLNVEQHQEGDACSTKDPGISISQHLRSLGKQCLATL